MKVHRLIGVMLVLLMMTGNAVVSVFATDVDAESDAPVASSETAIAESEEISENSEASLAEPVEVAETSIATEDIESAQSETAADDTDADEVSEDAAPVEDSDVPEPAEEAESTEIETEAEDNDAADTIVEQVVVEQVVEVVPAPIRIYDDYRDYEFTSSKDGTITLEDLLVAFDTGGTADETIEMLVNGEYYSFVVYSDGTMEGDLPKGFSVVDGKLVIKGYADDLEVYILDHKALSSTYEEAAYYEEPAASAKQEMSSNYVPAVTSPYAAVAYTIADADIEQTDAELKEDDVIHVAEFTADAPENESEVLGAYEESSQTGLPLAAVIVLIAAAAAGLMALLKFKHN